MGSNRREDHNFLDDDSMPSDSDVMFDENTISEEEKEELGVPAPSGKKACPDCGKMLTWLADGSRPRAHKCEPKNGETKENVVEEVMPQAPSAISTSGVTADLVIQKFIETRDEIDKRKKALRLELTELEALQERRTNWLKGEMDRLGVDGFKTSYGTVFTDWKDSATVADRETFFAWIQSEWEERNNFLENRVSKTAVKQMLEDGETPPPGVNYTKFKDVKIRRA